MENIDVSIGGTRAYILNQENNIVSNVYTITEGPDRKGNYLLVDEATQRRVRVHPTRILRHNNVGSPVYRNNTGLFAACPLCDMSREFGVEIAAETATCARHGSFGVDWSEIAFGPMLNTTDSSMNQTDKTSTSVKSNKISKATSKSKTQNIKTSTKIDFNAIRAAGELWTKTGVEFDYPDFEVQAHVFIISDGKNSRKMCFNSYNATWGKHSKDDDLKAFLANQSSGNNKNVGYYIKGTIDEEQQKLIKKGYIKQN